MAGEALLHDGDGGSDPQVPQQLGAAANRRSISTAFSIFAGRADWATCLDIGEFLDIRLRARDHPGTITGRCSLVCASCRPTIIRLARTIEIS
jgi:hypothetical protein